MEGEIQLDEEVERQPPTLSEDKERCPKPHEIHSESRRNPNHLLKEVQ